MLYSSLADNGILSGAFFIVKNGGDKNVINKAMAMFKIIKQIKLRYEINKRTTGTILHK